MGGGGRQEEYCSNTRAIAGKSSRFYGETPIQHVDPITICPISNVVSGPVLCSKTTTKSLILHMKFAKLKCVSQVNNVLLCEMRACCYITWYRPLPLSSSVFNSYKLNTTSLERRLFGYSVKLFFMAVLWPPLLPMAWPHAKGVGELACVCNPYDTRVQ